MLGCIQPMSSPMMKRMLGFCPCWADAGMLAIVVAVHITTRAPQIVLNRLMVAFLDVGCRKARAAAFAHLHPPTENPLPIHVRSCSGNRLNAERAENWAKQRAYAMRLRQMHRLGHAAGVRN